MNYNTKFDNNDHSLRARGAIAYLSVSPAAAAVLAMYWTNFIAVALAAVSRGDSFFKISHRTLRHVELKTYVESSMGPAAEWQHKCGAPYAPRPKWDRKTEKRRARGARAAAGDRCRVRRDVVCKCVGMS